MRTPAPNPLVLSTLAILSPAAVAQEARPKPGEITPVFYRDVTISGDFWTPRLAAIKGATLAANRHQCEITGRIANFERAALKHQGKPFSGQDTPDRGFQGLLFNDSDVYKVMEGWAYLIGTETDAARKAELDRDLDAWIAKIASAQRADGYIDTYYTLKAGEDKIFTREEHDHETYCMGHLIEAGVAHFQATGKRNLLGVAIKAADFLNNLYGPDKFTAPPGHEEVELALVKLAAVTGDKKYSALAGFLVAQRGKPHRKLDGSTYGPWGDYAQDHAPAGTQTEAVGHAVRAGYFYSGMADLSRLGLADYTPALTSLWDDITQRRIFVTGGIGPSGHNEGFTVPYDIPINGAYQETCASIALCLWAHRMFLLTGDGKYMEQFEKTLYNAALAGVSLDGSKFFYVNPMVSKGGHARQDWFGCACCPPNVLRFFSSLGDYAYATKTAKDGTTIYVNLFVDSTAAFMVNGKKVTITQKTNYPWDGKVKISLTNTSDQPITLAIRANPGMQSMTGVEPHDGYGRLAIQPGNGGGAEWEIPMTPTRVYADPRVKASVGKVAIMRGPLVYAAEGIDNPAPSEPRASVSGSLNDLVLPVSATITERTGGDGIPVLVATGSRVGGVPNSGLYRGLAASSDSASTQAPITLRPYFMWGNRGAGSLKVWLPESPQFLDPQPPKGLKISASYVGNGDGVDALADSILPDDKLGSGDGTIPRFTFWPHKGDGTKTETLTYTFDAPRAIGKVAVYWFDDTGVGECRVPKAATLEYLDPANGKDWKPVMIPATGGGEVPTAVSTDKNKLNEISFPPITTRGLRLKVTLPDRMSTGVLEWTVGN